MVAVEHVKATYSGLGPTKPFRTVAQLQAKRELHRAEVALASSSRDAHDRCNLLDDVATAIAEKHRLYQWRDIGRLPEAVEYAKQALESVPYSHVRGVSAQWKGNICNTLQTAYRMMYDRSKNPRFLDEAIKYCEQAVDHMMHYEAAELSASWQRTYGRRKSLLASLLQMRYDSLDPEIGGDEIDFNVALNLQASAADDIMSDLDSYTQFSAFCNTLVEKAGVTNDVRFIDSAIWLRKHLPKKMLKPGDEDLDFSQSNYCENSGLLCRKWHMTRTDADFYTMIERSREMVRFESEKEKPRDYITDPNNPLHVLRICGINIAVDIGVENSRWAAHVPTFDTAIALFVILTNMLPMETLADFEEREFPVHAVNYMMEKRWQATRDPAHGFALDDINIHCAQHNACMETLKAGQTLVSNNIGWSSYGLSAVTRKPFWCFDKPSVPLQPPRFLFLDPVSPETWIRKRNDNGTLDLGATEQDTDIWDFCRKYHLETRETAERVKGYLEDHIAETVVTMTNTAEKPNAESNIAVQQQQDQNTESQDDNNIEGGSDENPEISGVLPIDPNTIANTIEV